MRKTGWGPPSLCNWKLQTYSGCVQVPSLQLPMKHHNLILFLYMGLPLKEKKRKENILLILALATCLSELVLWQHALVPLVIRYLNWSNFICI